MADELVDVYDKDENSLSVQMKKSEVHEKRLWHRAALVWIFNSKGEILLQHRGDEVEMLPGCWDISCSGHLRAGETPEDAACREVFEELGITADKNSLKLIEHHKHIMVQKDKAGAKKNFYHINDVFILNIGNAQSKFCLQKEEVQNAKFMPIAQIERELNLFPQKFTPTKERWLSMLSVMKKHMHGGK